MNDDTIRGRAAAELTDEELEQQGTQAHSTRNWVFLLAAPSSSPGTRRGCWNWKANTFAAFPSAPGEGPVERLVIRKRRRPPGGSRYKE